MVDAVGIEVVGHLGEAACKPLVALGGHGLPVVGGEAPVLSIAGKGIGWCAGLALQAEESGIAPCLHAGAADADRYVALEHYAMLVGVVGGMLELLVQVILYIKVEACIFGVLVVSDAAELGIGYQPRFVVLEETLVGG